MDKAAPRIQHAGSGVTPTLYSIYGYSPPHQHFQNKSHPGCCHQAIGMASGYCKIQKSPQIGFPYHSLKHSMKVDPLIPNTPPEPLHKEIVAPATLAIHTEQETIRFEQTNKFVTCKMAALTCVEIFMADFERPVCRL
jgi:hypothetical protein